MGFGWEGRGWVSEVEDPHQRLHPNCAIEKRVKLILRTLASNRGGWRKMSGGLHDSVRRLNGKTGT